MVSLIAFILAIFINIALHEFGHLLAAKKNGLEVTQYAIGMGPTLFQKDYKGTKYSLKLFPIGGFCEIPDLDASKCKSEWRHITVLLAGVAFNILIFLVSVLIYMATALSASNEYRILDVKQSAYEMGFRKDDIIISIDGDTDIEKQLGNVSEDRTFAIKREGSKENINIVVHKSDLVDGAIGISLSRPMYKDGKGTIEASADFTKQLLGSIPKLFKQIGSSVGKAYNPTSDYQSEDGITLISGAKYLYEQESESRVSFIDKFLELMIGLSFSLAIFNLLPYPSLDGGRVILVILEKITLGKFDKNIQAKVLSVSYILLLVFMLSLLIIDTIRL